MKKIRKLAAVLVALTLLTGCSATTVKVPPIKVPSPLPSESAAATPAPVEADETAVPIVRKKRPSGIPSQNAPILLIRGHCAMAIR